MQVVSDVVGALSAAAAAMIAVAAAAVCAALIVLLHPWLERHALVMPNARSSHRTPTPQGGGIAVMAAVVVAVGIAFALRWFDPRRPPEAVKRLPGVAPFFLRSKIESSRKFRSGVWVQAARDISSRKDILTSDTR